MKWRNEQLDVDIETVNDVVTAIRKLRSINNFCKTESEGNIDKFLIFI